MIGRAILEIILLMGIGAFFALTGTWIAKLKRVIWLPVFCLGFVNVLFIVFLNRMPDLSYRLPLFWFGEGRNEFLIMALCLPFLFGILIPQLPFRRQRVSVSVLTALGVFYFLVPPFLEPALLYRQFKDHENWIEGGVCMQTTNFTCGPAAAVTALRQLAVDANEGDIAIGAYTTRVWGTPAVSLASGLESMFADEGIQCEVRRFGQIAEMKDCCPVIAIVKFRPMVDHYVTVIAVDEDTVVFGDPLSGRETATHAEFAERWRQMGIVVKRRY